MKYYLIFTLSLMLLVVGCNSATQDSNLTSGQQIKLKAIEDSFNGFCVMTSTSDFDGKIQYNDAKNEFLMLDELFSEQISCNNDNDCYEFLLDQDDYRSMAPEFEPYLNCEAESITEINFKNN